MAGLSGGGGAGAGQVRAGRAFVELSLSDVDFNRALDRVKTRWRALGGLMAKLGAVAGGVGASIVAAFKPAFDALGEQSKVADLAELFGISGEKASRLFGIMKAGGSDLRDAQEGLATFGQRINDALSGKGEEAAALFKELGVGAEEFARLDTADQFFRLVEAVKASKSSLGPLNLLMKAVGEDTGKNLSGVLQLNADQMRELGDAFQTSSADLAESREAMRSLTLSAALMGRVLGQVATAIAPVVKEVAEQVKVVAGPLMLIVQNNRELFATLLKVAAGAVAVGAGFIAIGAVAAGFTATVTAIGTVLAGIWATLGLVTVALKLLVTPVGLVAAAMAGLGYVLITQTEEGQKFAAWIKGGLLEALSAFTTAWEGIVAAVRKGDLALAGQIAAKALQVAWEELAHTLTQSWLGLKFTAGDMWAKVTTGAKMALAEMATFVDKTFLTIGASIDSAFRSIVTSILGAAISVAEAVDKLDPTDRLKGAIEAAKRMRDAVAGGAVDVAPVRDARDAELADKKRKLAEADKAAEDARRAGHAADMARADADLAKAKKELADLVAKAKEPLPAPAPALPPNAPPPALAGRASELAGSRGSFSAAMAAQRFGAADSIEKKQLKKIEETANNTGRTAEILREVAKGLALK